MADNRKKEVLRALADLYSREHYAIDLCANLREPLGRGDTVDIPNLGTLTVEADGQNPTGSPVAQAVSTPALPLVADLHPTIFADLPLVDQIQLLDGGWADGVALDATTQLKNSMDNGLLSYAAREVAFDTDGTYHENAAGAALTDTMVLNLLASQRSDHDGAHRLAMFVHPFGNGAIQKISGFQPNIQVSAEDALKKVGIPLLGMLYGVPVFETNAVRRNISSAVISSSITSNALTLVVAAGHGFVPGMLITTAGLSENVTTAAAITSVTATTIVVPLTATNDATNGAGTVAGRTCMNVLVDVAQGLYVSQQRMPTVDIVKKQGQTGHELQCSSVWGRRGRPGWIRVLHTPGSAVTV